MSTPPIDVEIIGGDICDGNVYAVRPYTRTLHIPMLTVTLQDPWPTMHPPEQPSPRITTIVLNIETDGVNHWAIWPGDEHAQR